MAGRVPTSPRRVGTPRGITRGIVHLAVALAICFGAMSASTASPGETDEPTNAIAACTRQVTTEWAVSDLGTTVTAHIVGIDRGCVGLTLEVSLHDAGTDIASRTQMITGVSETVVFTLVERVDMETLWIGVS